VGSDLHLTLATKGECTHSVEVDAVGRIGTSIHLHGKGQEEEGMNMFDFDYDDEYGSWDEDGTNEGYDSWLDSGE
jgi:hypothetical protein